MSKNRIYKDVGNIIEKSHAFFVFSRRTSVISSIISNLLPSNSNILDIGCGDGTIDRKILSLRPDVKITGLDVLERKKSLIPVIVFDGKIIPFADNSYDGVLLIDTLHHTSNPVNLLREAVRVSQKYIIIKDHYLQGRMSLYILRFMDWIGNEAHDVNLPYNYYSYQKWEKIFEELGLSKEQVINRLNIYPFPFNLVFGRNYHFLGQLRK